MPQVDCTLTQGGGRSDATTTSLHNADPINNPGTWFYLLRPDVSSIPTTATVDSAELRLYSEIAYGADTFDVWECLQQWVGNEADWTEYSTGNNWNTAGALGSGTDRSASTIGTHSGSAGDDSVWIAVALTTSVVQAWVAGTRDDGMKIIFSGAADYSGVPDVSTPPVLRVNYTIGGATTAWFRA